MAETAEQFDVNGCFPFLKCISAQPASVVIPEKIKALADLALGPAASEKHSLELWSSILAEAIQPTTNIDTLRHLFREFFLIFPLCGKVWKVYLETEIRRQSYDLVDQIFATLLPLCLYYELYALYLDYICNTKYQLDIPNLCSSPTHSLALPAPQTTTTNQITIIAQQPAFFKRDLSNDQIKGIARVYDYAVEMVGFEYDATPLWKAYIDFMQHYDPNMNHMRQLYKRALLQATRDSDILLKQYEAYEKSIGASGAAFVVSQRILGTLQAAFYQGHEARSHMNAHLSPLNRGIIAVPPGLLASKSKLAPHQTTSKREQIPISFDANLLLQPDATELKQWLVYLDWEKSDPFRTKIETPHVYDRRLDWAYKQGLMSFPFSPELWLDYYYFFRTRFLKSNESGSSTSSINPQQNQPVLSASSSSDDIPSFNVAQQAVLSAILNAGFYFCGHDLVLAFTWADLEETFNKLYVATAIYDRLLSIYNPAENAHSPIAQDLQLCSKQTTLIFIQYIGFMNRVHGIQAARKVFGLARKSSLITHHVFVYSALMEYHCCNDEKTSFRIFEYGLKQFRDAPGYIEQYIHFVYMINDKFNTDLILDRLLTMLGYDSPVYAHYAQHAQKFDKIQTSERLETGFILQQQDMNPDFAKFLASRAIRYSYLDLQPVSTADLTTFTPVPKQAYKTHLKRSPLAPFLQAHVASVSNHPLMPSLSRAGENITRPDVSKMKLCAPTAQPSFSLGVPPFIGAILTTFPFTGYSQYHGPLLNVNLFIDQFIKLDFTHVAPSISNNHTFSGDGSGSARGDSVSANKRSLDSATEAESHTDSHDQHGLPSEYAPRQSASLDAINAARSSSVARATQMGHSGHLSTHNEGNNNNNNNNKNDNNNNDVGDDDDDSDLFKKRMKRTITSLDF